ncbi:hypothetical protein MNEG_11246 [Monoraphidium neglectum]|uniref:UDENN domain-containing protein n=1 Tax=Monoraphidium neglectum TaxID=145388 RepID=A0A0D2M683_9CHLO|nr:hypothetical protein MNEG_11246 [Monoraphidium neglectum]KIY96716.1 hypothetical protein MNEG_11246 [Monoraphidium neglectum]|eukprot:XP_013895736.1 hypothetical protein MNEG_11246 [Monoraphidium neglectum]
MGSPTSMVDARAAGATLPLFEHFVVCGLSGHGLQTVQGEPGFLGTDVNYKPSFLDRLPHSDNPKRQPPPQLPTCCLPAGVNIILKEDIAGAVLNPRMYAVVLTEGDGTKVYASCLAYYDELPAELRARHEQLCGARALKALCLLSHQPYLACSERVLRELCNLAFVTGSPVPVVDVISHLLAVPCPSSAGSQARPILPSSRAVCFSVGSERLVACPPLPVGPPAGELSLRPLAELLSPHNMAALFVAVLLERRVLLRSRQYRLLTLVAESVVRLLHPFKFQHVYIPVMPYSLVEYLEV